MKQTIPQPAAPAPSPLSVGSADKVRTLSAWGIGCLIGFALVIALALGFVFYISVQADATNTPRPTSTPWVIGTVGQYGNDFSCPTGNPYGWLTVTPDPLWLLFCSQCVDRFATSTPVPTKTNTPAPTVTGTPPTVTPTPTATSTPAGLGITCGSCQSGSSCTQHASDLIEITIISPQIYANAGQTFCGYTVAASSVVTVYGYADISADLWSVSGGFDGSNVLAHFNLQLIGQDGWVNYASGYMGPGLSSISFDETFTLSNGPRNTTQRQDGSTTAYMQLSQSDRVLWQLSGEVWLSTSYISGPPSPTPTPTSTPESGYCDVVLEEDGEEELPFVEYGDEECFKLLPEIDLSWAGLEGVIPETWVCLQEVSFRDVQLLGVNVNLMVIIYTVLSFAVVLWIFRT